MNNAVISDTVINELWTIRDYVRYAVSQFNQANLYYGHGTDNAWDEALTLVIHLLNIQEQFNAELLDARLTLDERQSIMDGIKKRTQDNMPVSYITHSAGFAGHTFYVDERVLIPRSPIAELIEQHFSPWLNDDTDEINILDLCTGSGCIAIACAYMFPGAKVDAVDISPDALDVAKINIERHEISSQVTPIQSDLFSAIPSDKRYDLIVSNPPYVDAREMASLPKEYLHEPRLGLAAGDDGLLFAEKIIAQALNHLTDEGILIVEVGASEWALQEKYPHIPFMWLEFARGGSGVFLLTVEHLRALAV